MRIKVRRVRTDYLSWFVLAMGRRIDGVSGMTQVLIIRNQEVEGRAEAANRAPRSSSDDCSWAARGDTTSGCYRTTRTPEVSNSG
jgi:hypothetical protein